MNWKKNIYLEDEVRSHHFFEFESESESELIRAAVTLNTNNSRWWPNPRWQLNSKWQPNPRLLSNSKMLLTQNRSRLTNVSHNQELQNISTFKFLYFFKLYSATINNANVKIKYQVGILNFGICYINHIIEQCVWVMVVLTKCSIEKYSHFHFFLMFSQDSTSINNTKNEIKY